MAAIAILATDELAPTGAIRSVKGVLPIPLRAKAEGLTEILVPADNAAETAVVDGLCVIPVHDLHERGDDELDFAEVIRQKPVKRDIDIAAAGGHNVVVLSPIRPENQHFQT